MFDPSELEGEVDHSFFDSDCEDSSTSRDGGEKTEKGLKDSDREDSISSRDGGEKTEKGLKAEKENPPAHEKLHTKQTEKTNIGLSLKTDGKTKQLGKMAHDNDEKNLSPDETNKETLPCNAKHLGSKSRNIQFPKKLRNWCTRSPSPTSTEASVDADSESSYSRSNGKSSSVSSTFPKPNKSLFPRERKTRTDSAESQDVPTSHTEESDGTVTDVSSVSSPDISPLQSLELNQKEVAEESRKEQQQKESVPSNGLSNTHQDEDSDQDVDDCAFRFESLLGGKRVFHHSAGRNRKNYSFTNDDVWRIDRENQRLLRKLSHRSPRPGPGCVARKKTNMTSNSPLIRLSHSALNRQREQQRIKRENLAFLKRLTSVKPTPDLRRSERVADYQHQVGYVTYLTGTYLTTNNGQMKPCEAFEASS